MEAPFESPVDEVARLVAQRTSELAPANELLKHEIAERRRTEDALRESERESRLIVDSIPGMIALLTATGDLEVGNRQLLEYFGQTLEQLRSWRTNDTIHPDDLAHVIDVFTPSIASGRSYEIVQRFKRADGVYRWFFNRGFPLRDANGSVARWCVLLTDIDERKRAEDALRASELDLRRAHDHLTEAQRLSQTGSFSLDLERGEHYWSDEFYRICELEQGSPVTIHGLRDIVHPEDVSSCEAAIGRAMAGTEPDFYFRIVTARGLVKHLRGVGHRIADRPVFVGAVQDVTASKIAQEALNKAGAELAHVSRVTSLGALTASVAHEVNQPLSGIMTNAGTCLRMLDSAPPDIDGARETARRTIRDANRASDVITRLRALFSKKAFALEPLDLNEATREVIALSWNDLQRNRIVLRSELADELPIVTGDRVQLQQVVLNLLRNASDAMGDVHDRPRQLLLKTVREDGGGVRVTVRDAGVGVPAASLKSVFHAFHTTKSGGMGIGLFLSRSIVERHRGRLWVEQNGDGPGSTFSFVIPADVRSGAPTRTGKPAAPSADRCHHRQRGQEHSPGIAGDWSGRVPVQAVRRNGPAGHPECGAVDARAIRRMTTGNIWGEAYTVHSAIASRSNEVLTMPDVTSIVFVVDDDISVRESLELLIKSAGLRSETFASAQEFLSRPRATVPCCLILDVSLPGLNGLDLQQQLRDRTDMPIIFISGYGDVPMTVQAMKAGAIEFLTKPLRPDVVADAIRAGIERSRAALRLDSEMRALRNCQASLTPREREVMALVVSGLLNKQVAGELGISEITVKAHRGQVMRKMKADSLPDLVTMAARLGVRSPSHHGPSSESTGACHR